MPQSTTTRPEKPLSQQVSERMRRSEDERPFYTIKLIGMNVTRLDGTKERHLVAAVTKRREYLRRGETQTTYFVTAAGGCNCPDSVKAQEAGLVRPCKHQFMAEVEVAAQSSFPGEVEEPVDVTEMALTAEQQTIVDRLLERTAEKLRRATVRRRMMEDFPDFDPVLA